MRQYLEGTFLGLSKSDKEEFYRNQFEYYQKFNTSIIVIAVLASLTYFISDCQLFGRFAWETLIPRVSIIIPLIIFLGIRNSVDYKLEMLMSQWVGHSIMWHTIWAIYYLTNRQYASDGFLIMQLVILMLGFASTFEVAVISQLLVIVNIIVSNSFNHYEDLSLMISLGLPCAIGIAISNFVFTQSYYTAYKANKELATASYTDQLTGMFNRHKLSEIVKEDKIETDDSKVVTIIILDIDFFKKINDTYGHDKGDIILKTLAKTIKHNTSDSDLVIRWGGEEFLIVLYDCDERKAFNTAEDIRKSVEMQDNGINKITISLGVCQYDYKSYRNTVNKADEALYYAKEHGRNQTIAYSEMNA
jgi:diguanylate cyclase (GGDEF)-like protein